MNHFPTITFEINSESSNIVKVENFIDYIIEKLEIPEALRARITLPVLEAVTNSILFRNETTQNTQKTIKLWVTKRNKKLIVTVKDTGKGMNTNKLPEKLKNKGFYMLISLPDQILFSHNGAKITMTYNLNSIETL